MNEVIISSIIGALATVLAGALVYFLTREYYKHTKEIENERMMKELFSEFNSRYDRLNESLNRISKECKTNEDIEKRPKLKNDLVDYFNLCAEEYFWHKKGRIDPLIWEAWSAGMNDWYKYPVIQEAWKKEIIEFKCISYYIKDKNDFFMKHQQL